MSRVSVLLTVFGVGSLIYEGLLLKEFHDNHTAINCQVDINYWTHYGQLAFITIQTYFIFKHAQVSCYYWTKYFDSTTGSMTTQCPWVIVLMMMMMMVMVMVIIIMIKIWGYQNPYELWFTWLGGRHHVSIKSSWHTANTGREISSFRG